MDGVGYLRDTRSAEEAQQSVDRIAGDVGRERHDNADIHTLADVQPVISTDKESS
jgi:hypothetical protein